MKFYFDEIESPIGPMTLLSHDDKLIRTDYGSMNELSEHYHKWMTRYLPARTELIHKPNAFLQVKSELKNYFDKNQPSFSVDLEFHGTPFQKAVWQSLYDIIPFGETRSYKDIAIAIGNPRAVRAVGGAVNKNPFSIIVPCHRVIGTNGKMVGYNGGLYRKEFLLKHENMVR
ncbi:methylated-DNA--[protein]-cysteine S-methyltransferase [Oceanobacillus sp. Castelsardo]|uniref:methylated-DNA--[protein]-cysteine S-methyltransferase n=1 Tax=Oceanobacillus sp. Castelsardo TaxID=1851204 RepID=UPI00083917C5|nr:methylated-DNA--[protein]-cysteine S-methyltransferase [Oceanobacillus sp. Castelsardo]